MLDVGRVRAVAATALVAALLSPLAAAAGPDAGVPPVADASPASRAAQAPRQQLLAAIGHYQRSEFDEARRLLKALTVRLKGERTGLAREVYTYLAYVHVAFGETEAAVEAFQRALDAQPDLALGAPSPRIAAALEEARRRHRARAHALDHDPPTQMHLPVAAAPHGRALWIEDVVRDPAGVRRVVLNYRTRGNRGFSSVTMELDRRGRYVATVPAVAVARPGVEYYLEAWDVRGNGPGLKGSAGAPIFVAVSGGPLVAPAQAARPTAWYKRWWVWAIAAGAAAAGGAIGAAVYFTRGESARLDVHLPKELNP